MDEHSLNEQRSERFKFVSKKGVPYYLYQGGKSGYYLSKDPNENNPTNILPPGWLIVEPWLVGPIVQPPAQPRDPKPVVKRRVVKRFKASVFPPRGAPEKQAEWYASGHNLQIVSISSDTVGITVVFEEN